eukprot:UN09581
MLQTKNSKSMHDCSFNPTISLRIPPLKDTPPFKTTILKKKNLCHLIKCLIEKSHIYPHDTSKFLY